MPQVLPVLGSIALNAAIGIGASVLANAIRPQRASSTQSVTTTRGLKFELTIGETVALSAIWGRGRTGGQLTFAQEYGANNQFLKLKIDCGRGWFDSLETVIADEKALTLTGSNNDTHGRVAEEYRDGSGNPRVWFKYYDGAPGQAADAGLIAAAPTRWGVNHKSTATPYVIVTLSYDADLFPSSTLPAFGFVWRGLRLYDWRKDSTMPGGAGAHRWDDQSTWTWTDNPAVMAWNWRRGYWRNGLRLFGMGFSRYANDLSYFTAAANLCEEDLYFEETGATLQRYAFGREIFDDEEHLTVLRQFEESWCGASFDRGGAYAPVPAASVMPVLTLENHHRVDGAAVSANRWGKVSAKKTKIHGSYSPIADLFISTPYAARINVDLEALTRGPKAQAFDQPYEHRPERAQMRAEIALRRNLFGATRTETFGPVANVLEPGDAITRNCEWGATLMIVESVEPGPDGIGKTVTMTGWSNTIVPDPDEGFLDLPAVAGPLPTAATRVLQVPDFEISALQRITGGNEEPFARAAWTAIEDPNCEEVIIKVWPTAIPGEVEEFSSDARLAASKILGPLRPNTNYTAVAQLTRRDLRRTYDTDPVTFTTGAFRPGTIGSADLSVELSEFYTDTQAFLNTTLPAMTAELNDIQTQLADLAGAGDYDIGAAYDAGDIVKFEDGLYRALQAVPAGVDPTDTDYWEKIGDYASLGEAVAALAALINEVETDLAATNEQVRSNTRTTRRQANALLAAAMLNSEQGADQTIANTDQLAASALVSETVRTEVSRIDGTTTALAEQIDIVQAQVEEDVAEAISTVTTRVENVEGDVTAQATAINLLRAALGGNSSEVQVKWEAVAAPSGYAARYVIRCQVESDGQLRQASIFIDVPANPALPARIGFSADNVVFFLADGTPVAMFDENGDFRNPTGTVLISMLSGGGGDFSFG